MKIKNFLYYILIFFTSLSLSDCSKSSNVSTVTDPQFTIDQTISDATQSKTLAFSGIAMITGNFQAQSFFPPGKVSDYTGFQYLRDNDPDGMGHNTSFLTRVACNVIYILNEDQLAKLDALAIAQQANIDSYGYKRFAIMKAFRRLIDNDIPSGSALNLNSIKKASKELYRIDGQVSFDRAKVYAEIINSFDSNQIAYLQSMKGNGWCSWPDIDTDDVKDKMGSLTGSSVTVMTYAGDLFSWYAGSMEADVYFCPERHGTYFGSFYMKDAPAIGHEGYSIDTEMTAEAGVALCDSAEGYVTDSQAAIINALVETQKNNLYAGTENIVSVRTQITTLLRELLTAPGDARIAEIETQVLSLSETYGNLDGENNYNYAIAFASVYQTLDAAQITKLGNLRASLMKGTYTDGTSFDFTTCSTYYLYSAEIEEAKISDYITNTDYLFAEPAN